LNQLHHLQTDAYRLRFKKRAKPMISKLKENSGELSSREVSQSVAPDSTSDNPTLRLAFSVKETAAMLGLSEKTIRRLIARGLLRSSRALRHLLIPKKEIDRFLDQTTTK